MILSRAFLLLVSLTTVLAVAAEPGEVRIRSGVYAPRPPGTIQVQATLVEVGATVRDSRGKVASGLTASDFELTDNGKPQAIAVFTEQQRKPEAEAKTASRPARTVALYFDDFNSSAAALLQAKKAAVKLLSAGFEGTGDRVGVFTDSGTVSLDFTSDTKALIEAVERVDVHRQGQRTTLGSCPVMNAYQAYALYRGVDPDLEARAVKEATACNCPAGDDPACARLQPGLVRNSAADAWNSFRASAAASLGALRAVVKRLAVAPGERVLVMLSPGFVTGEFDQEKSSIVDAAIGAHIVLSSLDPTGLDPRMMTGPQVLTMGEFMGESAHATGGTFVHNTNDISGALMTLTSVPEVSYVLGFVPAEAADGKVHRLKLRVRKTGYQVESRTAYFAALPPPPPPPGAQERIDAAVLSAEPMDGVSATVSVKAASPADGDKVVVRILVNSRVLPFLPRGDKSAQQLTFSTVLEDAKGTVLEGKQAVMDLVLSAKTRSDFERTGIEASFTFKRPKVDGWRVRQVVREAVDGRIGAWSLTEAPAASR